MGLSLLLVDDDRLLAQALGSDLRLLSHDVTIATDGRAAVIAISRDHFDAVILDRMMPHLDGMSVLARIREDGMTVPVVMLTALSQSDEKVAGLDAGADDYVVKPVSAAELNARLAAVLRGRSWTLPGTDTLRAGDIVVSPVGFRAWRGGQAILLGKLEVKLLAEFVRHADAVLTRAMLIERVWGYDFDPRSNIVDAYVRRLRQKLTEAGGNDPILTVRGVGYTLRS